MEEFISVQKVNWFRRLPKIRLVLIWLKYCWKQYKNPNHCIKFVSRWHFSICCYILCTQLCIKRWRSILLLLVSFSIANNAHWWWITLNLLSMIILTIEIAVFSFWQSKLLFLTIGNAALICQCVHSHHLPSVSLSSHLPHILKMIAGQL